MDQATLELLEFDAIRGIAAGYSATSLGKARLAEMAPGKDLAALSRELDLVSEMVDALQAGNSPPFGGVHDVRLDMRRAEIGTMLTAEQLLRIADTLTATSALYRYRSRLDGRFGRINDMLATVEDLGPVARTVTAMIDGRGHVVDSASPELAAIRQSMGELDERAKHEINKLLRDPELRKILRFPNATMNGDHYVLPVPVNHRHKVPGVVHRSSGTGETIFVEPAALAKLSSERSYLKSEEDRESRKILRKLSGEVGKHSKAVHYALDIIAHLDAVTAKAKYSQDYGMCRPDLNDEGKLWLRSARHPLLQHLFRTTLPSAVDDDGKPVAPKKREVVPIEIRLGIGFRMLVITGPNTGGKTVCLKTTGLICAMALSGMHIPATEGSQVPMLDHIMADIGDEQNLQQSLSTFSSHITRISSILKLATAKSLVLLDEMGAGTDPTEGAALGRAILDHLDKSECLCMVTTHLGDLKTYAFTNDNVENGAVEFDIETLKPTYRLFIGQFGMSNALRIAKRLKLPREVIDKARKYLKRRRGKGGELLRLQQLREDAEKAKSEALSAKHESEQSRKEFESRIGDLEKQKAKDQALREWRSRLQPNESVFVQRFGKVGKVVRQEARKNAVIVSVGIGQWEIPFEEILPPEAA